MIYVAEKQNVGKLKAKGYVEAKKGEYDQSLVNKFPDGVIMIKKPKAKPEVKEKVKNKDGGKK